MGTAEQVSSIRGLVRTLVLIGFVGVLIAGYALVLRLRAAARSGSC